MKTNNKLVVTNYDNFKNADFFIEQYFKAQEMLKEVNDFFASFVNSKLFTSSQLRNLRPSYLGNHSDYSSEFIWTNNFIERKLMDKGYDSKISHVYDEETNTYRYKNRDYEEYNPPLTIDEYNKVKQELTNNCKEICKTIADIIEDTEFDCYYVLKEDNSLEEFIPVASKDTIKFDFQKDKGYIIISGYFYHYHEWGGQWGKSESRLDKVIKYIYVDRNTNNVVKVERKSETVRKGNADGKSYWDSHSNYCLSSMNKNAINTQTFDNVIKKLKHYLYNDSYSHQLYSNNKEAKQQAREMDLKHIMKYYAPRYEKIYKKKLTQEVIDYCSPWGKF